VHASAAVLDRNWVNIQWLARLRWAQIAGQAATVVLGQFVLDGALPMTTLLLVVGVCLVSNLALELYFFGDRRRDAAGVRDAASVRTVHDWQIAVVMMLDVGILTTHLYFTGGPHNPFGFLYLVQIALATQLLRAMWTWMLVGLSFVAFGVLLISHEEFRIPPESYAIGMWVALGVAAAFIVYFLRRITGALAEREEELSLARGLASRQERLASLATMAAGAAHELSTPLGTVALAAKELERALTGAEHSELAADARLIREQVGRCRAILEQMAQGAGTVGEGVAACTVAELLDEAVVSIRATPTVHRDIPGDLASWPLRLPPRAVSQALRSLITNAQDASPPGATVLVLVRREDGILAITIRDRGPGIPAEVLERIGEPFFTTKAPGRGMGLGLYLARAVVEGVGGSLDIHTRPEDGTEVRVRLPTDVSAPRRAPAEAVAPGLVRSGESPQPPVVSNPP